MTKPLVVCALDIAKHRTGFAIGSPSKGMIEKGVYELAGKWERNEGPCLKRWRDFLREKFEEHSVSYLALERLLIDMRDFTYDGTVPMAQMHGAALLLAEDMGIRQGAVAISSWRSHFLGTAQAPKHLGKSQRTNWLKDEAVKKALARDWYCVYHDEAEALGIMDFALFCLDNDYAHAIGPHIRRAEQRADVARYRGEEPRA
jgi:hypothetical protein